MKKLILTAVFLLVMNSLAFCGYVQGYYRKDGSYVGGYYRSDPDSSKSNNYGSKGKNDSDSDYSSPYSRDYDSDGTPNYLDYDDDNDGTMDDDE